MVGVSASVGLPLHHKVQKFSSGTGSRGWSGKRAVKRLWYDGGGGPQRLPEDMEQHDGLQPGDSDDDDT